MNSTSNSLCFSALTSTKSTSSLLIFYIQIHSENSAAKSQEKNNTNIRFPISWLPCPRNTETTYCWCKISWYRVVVLLLYLCGKTQNSVHIWWISVDPIIWVLVLFIVCAFLFFSPLAFLLCCSSLSPKSSPYLVEIQKDQAISYLFFFRCG